MLLIVQLVDSRE